MEDSITFRIRVYTICVRYTGCIAIGLSVALRLPKNLRGVVQSPFCCFIDPFSTSGRCVCLRQRMSERSLLPLHLADCIVLLLLLLLGAFFGTYLSVKGVRWPASLGKNKQQIH
jgi:hypothetical protein